jgi:hypothetical protein
VTDRPEIVCLCGSTRFYDEFQRANYELTMAGKIVLTVGFYPHQASSHAFKPGGTGCCAICDDLPGQGEHAKQAHGEGIGHDSIEKVKLDELHLRKIDLADRVLVLNVGGYIGDSTRSEINYARRPTSRWSFWNRLRIAGPHMTGDSVAQLRALAQHYRDLGRPVTEHDDYLDAEFRALAESVELMATMSEQDFANFPSGLQQLERSLVHVADIAG